MRPLIVAHRGASLLAPENTLAAFRAAQDAGADGVELDVQMTQDGQLIIAHDFITDRILNVHYDVFDTTFEALRKLDFGFWNGVDFSSERMPTLEESLDVCRNMKTIHVELKPYFDRDKDFVPRVLDTILDMGCENNVVITSFQQDLLRQVKEQMPQVKTNMLFMTFKSLYFPPPALWEELGLTNGEDTSDPVLEKLAEVNSFQQVLDLVENPDELDGENGKIYQTLRDRVLALLSNYPGKNMLEILEDMFRQSDLPRYVSQFDFPVDYVGTSYYEHFRDPDLVKKFQAMGIGSAPWPMFNETELELRSILKMEPEMLLTNKPDLLHRMMDEQDAANAKD